MTDKLICPKTHKKLFLSDNGKFYQTDDGKIKYPIEQGVIRFLDQNDDFYEGAYTATVKWMPKSEKWYHTWLLKFLQSGFLWLVNKNVKKDGYILELGCGGGVSYFGEKFNMIGLDLSFKSLLHVPEKYIIKAQADAAALPLSDASLDAIISSCFWEHIQVSQKEKMLKEFNRVLKQNGKIIFMYDVVNDNCIINLIKRINMNYYTEEFLIKDGHYGYQTWIENEKLFIENGFKIIEHIGIEKTILQTPSVYMKLLRMSPKFRYLYAALNWSYKNRLLHFIHILLVALFDKTYGKFISMSKARVIQTIAIKN